jgi:hypothetical protein
VFVGKGVMGEFFPHLRYSPTFKNGKLKGYIELAPSLVMVI